MLMEGWYPCIPGWHHDDVPRSREDKQPNYDTPEYFAEHRMCTIGNSAMTQFINVDTELDEVKLGSTVYGVWNKEVEKKYADTKNIYTVSSGEVVDFDWQDFHRGVAAEKRCWRFFIRASRGGHGKFANEIRNQVQTYLKDPEAGW